MTPPRINLLPKEIAAGRRVRQTRYALTGGLAGLLALMLIIFGVEVGRASAAKSKLGAQDRKNAALQTQVNQLSRFARLQFELANKQKLLVVLTRGEVRWSVILSDLATIIPADVWITSLTGSVQLPATGATPTTNAAGATVATTYGQIQLSGCTLLPRDGTHLEVAKLLVRLGVPEGFLGPYLSLSTKGADTCPVNYNSSVSLSDKALRHNQRGGDREI